MSNVKRMKQMKRTGMSVAIFLNVVTLWFYSIFWLHMRSRELDSVAKKNKIPTVIITCCYILWAVSWIYSYGVWFLYWVVKLFLLFELRARIHRLCDIKLHSKYWISGVWLFLFGFLYLIVKIDQFPVEEDTPGVEYYKTKSK